MLTGEIIIHVMDKKGVVMEIMDALLIGINVIVAVLVQMRLLAFKTLPIIFIILLLLLILRLMKFLICWIIKLVEVLEMGLVKATALEAVTLLIIYKFSVEVIQQEVMEVVLEAVLLHLLEIVYHQIFW